MNKKLTTVILVFCISAVALKSALSAGMTEKSLLPDGFILRGIEGKLVRQDANEGWFFEFDSAARRNKEVLKAGTNLELLPSSTLERMLADANDRSAASPVRSKASGTTTMASRQTSNGASYRLWARVTRYKDRNFIFPEYFLPLGKAKPSRPSTIQQSEEKARPSVVDSNDELGIPQQILEKLESRRTVRRQPTERRAAIKQNYVLVNKTGFIRDSGHVTLVSAKAEAVAGRGTRYGVFVFNAFGLNIQQTTVRLLPCQALELAEQQADTEPDPIRFKIAGIVTEYKGEKFLLLQRATRVYSYGNFAK